MKKVYFHHRFLGRAFVLGRDRWDYPILEVAPVDEHGTTSAPGRTVSATWVGFPWAFQVYSDRTLTSLCFGPLVLEVSC